MLFSDWLKVKNFKATELKHPELMMPEVVFLLDKEREDLGYPIIITSDARPGDENKKAGGVSDSLHQTGEALDGKCLKITPLDLFLFSCRYVWTEIGLYEIGILHWAYSLNPARKIKRFYGFQCPSCIEFAPNPCPFCKGIGKIYRPISEQIIRWHLSDRSVVKKKEILGIK